MGQTNYYFLSTGTVLRRDITSIKPQAGDLYLRGEKVGTLDIDYCVFFSDIMAPHAVISQKEYDELVAMLQ